MAGSTTEDLPYQRVEDAKKMAILLASPSGEDPSEGRQRQTQRRAGRQPGKATTRSTAAVGPPKSSLTATTDKTVSTIHRPDPRTPVFTDATVTA